VREERWYAPALGKKVILDMARSSWLKEVNSCKHAKAKKRRLWPVEEDAKSTLQSKTIACPEFANYPHIATLKSRSTN
jgi:hypothetical protein